MPPRSQRLDPILRIKQRHQDEVAQQVAAREAALKTAETADKQAAAAHAKNLKDNALELGRTTRFRTIPGARD